MSNHFNGLTPAEHERLSLIMEEAGEVIQIIGKIFRHGYKSTHPESVITNKEELEREVGDLLAAIRFSVSNGDLLDKNIRDLRKEKYNNYLSGVYLHHQEINYE